MCNVFVTHPQWCNENRIRFGDSGLETPFMIGEGGFDVCFWLSFMNLPVSIRSEPAPTNDLFFYVYNVSPQSTRLAFLKISPSRLLMLRSVAVPSSLQSSKVTKPLRVLGVPKTLARTVSPARRDTAK